MAVDVVALTPTLSQRERGTEPGSGTARGHRALSRAAHLEDQAFHHGLGLVAG